MKKGVFIILSALIFTVSCSDETIIDNFELVVLMILGVRLMPNVYGKD